MGEPHHVEPLLRLFVLGGKRVSLRGPLLFSILPRPERLPEDPLRHSVGSHSDRGHDLKAARRRLRRADVPHILSALRIGERERALIDGHPDERVTVAPMRGRSTNALANGLVVDVLAADEAPCRLQRCARLKHLRHAA